MYSPACHNPCPAYQRSCSNSKHLQAITLNNLLQLNNFCNHLCLAIVVLFQQKFNLSLRFPFLVVQLQKKSPFQLLQHDK